MYLSRSICITRLDLTCSEQIREKFGTETLRKAYRCQIASSKVQLSRRIRCCSPVVRSLIYCRARTPCSARWRTRVRTVRWAEKWTAIRTRKKSETGKPDYKSAFKIDINHAFAYLERSIGHGDKFCWLCSFPPEKRNVPSVPNIKQRLGQREREPS